MKVIRRYQIPANAGWHERTLRGPVLYVDSRTPEVVEFWAVYNDAFVIHRRDFMAVGDEADVPTHSVYHGSVVHDATVNHGAEVWHLISRMAR